MKSELIWLVRDQSGKPYSAYPGGNLDLAKEQAAFIGGRVNAKTVSREDYDALAGGRDPAELFA